ncbi:MAG: 3D domain-containing protein [Eudoraea sp.]|nr:3D domain-containing protein [Eudoraea sp.]
MFRKILIGYLIVLFGLNFSCKEEEKKWTWNPLTVTATAYNSVIAQTKSIPNVAAWGDTLKPGMKCIAVSRDLIKKGLKRNTPVKIEGFEGVFLVKDKMHSRWENRIDIYMGEDVQMAKEWGRKKVKILYGLPLAITEGKTK